MSSDCLEKINSFMNFWNTRDRVATLVNSSTNLYVATQILNGNNEGLGTFKMVSKATDTLGTALRYGHWFKMFAQAFSHGNEYSKTRSSISLLEAVSSVFTGFGDVLRDYSFITQVITFQKPSQNITKAIALSEVASLISDLVVIQRQLDVAYSMFNAANHSDHYHEVILRELNRLRSVKTKKFLQIISIVIITFVIPRVKDRDIKSRLSFFAAFFSFGAAFLAVHTNWTKSKATVEIAHRIQDLNKLNQN